MMALKALSQSVSVAAGLLLEDNFFHVKILQIDICCSQEPIFSKRSQRGKAATK